MNRLRSVHLDRKLSSTARVPKRSTIVESPTGKVAHATDMAHRPHEVPASARHAPQSAQQSSVRPPKAPQVHVPPAQLPHQQRSLPSPGMIDTNVQSQVIRPPFARGNTAIKIVDESGPSSPAGALNDSDGMVGGVEDGITLADIPQLVEAAQAREQRRSLPSQSTTPYVAELNPVQLAIVKHCAVLVLQRSPLRDQFDLDEILELVELKKSSFWNKLFKPGNDKKNVKKKGEWGNEGAPCSRTLLYGSLPSDSQAFSVYLWSFWSNVRAQIRCLVLRVRRSGSPALWTMSSLQCGKWVR